MSASPSPTRQHPRTPLLTWSPVVLLSALLLSPMTAGALWHALAERFPQVFAALVDSAGDYAAAPDAAPFAAGSAISDDSAHPADATDETRRETAEVPRRADLPCTLSFFAPATHVYPRASDAAPPAFDGGSVSGRAPPVLG